MIRALAFLAVVGAGLLTANPLNATTTILRTVCGERYTTGYYEMYCMDDQTGYTCSFRWYYSGAYRESCYDTRIA